jgi:hypothetical protein
MLLHAATDIAAYAAALFAGDMSTKQPPPLRAGRIVAELFDKEVPKTAENFR